MNLNHDRRQRRRDRVIRGLGLLRKLCLQTSWLLLDYDDHENDDEHQQNVNQGSDVHFWTCRKRTTACRGECHLNFLSLQGKPARECPETLDTSKMKEVPWRYPHSLNLPRIPRSQPRPARIEH